jgi:LuxR family maltose regulon positive regulatory protein
VRAVGFVPTEAKLRSPQPDNALVFRGELVDQLRDSAQAPVVLISAPSGYGKTSLVRQWAEEDERSFAWLALDDEDNDPAALTTYLMLALREIDVIDAEVISALTGHDPPVTSATLPLLGRILRHSAEPFVLVLDESDSLTSPAALAVVETVAKHLPEGAQLVVIARRAPELPWHHLRAERQLVDIGIDQLRLATAESRALLKAADLDPARGDVSALVDRSEGWATGLYLAARSAQASSGSGDVSNDIAGDDTLVAGYLREELLAQLSPEWQTFLIRASVLDKLSGALCDATLATEGSGLMLQEVERANLFLVALDHEDNWFRFHHMFGEMLTAELHRREPALMSELHSRASQWYEDAADIDRAITHAQEAGESERAASLVWSQVDRMLSADFRPVVTRWLDSFPTEQILTRARLSLAAAWVALGRGQPVEHWISAAERGIYDATRSGEAESVTAGTSLLRAAIAAHGVARMGADARIASGLQRAGDPWRTVARYFEGVSLHLLGQRHEAHALLEETAQFAAALSLHTPQALISTQLAMMALEDNDWKHCEEHAERATSLLEEHGLSADPAMSLIHCMTALMLAKRGDVEEAKQVTRRSLRMMATNVTSAPWSAVQSRYLLARAHLILGDNAAARCLLSEAQTHMSTTPDAVTLRDDLGDAWQQVEQLPLGVASGVSTLTTAELRVLQYLPTYLSFEQISQRLFVSRNTVKTQAIAAYRKLGVTSRGEAVKRAHALGLVDT